MRQYFIKYCKDHISSNIYQNGIYIIIVLISSYPHVDYSLQGIKYKLQVELQHTLKIRYYVNI